MTVATPRSAVPATACAMIAPRSSSRTGAHSCQMIGSFHEAEDLAQETLLRAKKARDRYDRTWASVPTLLDPIATNACLSALEGRAAAVAVRAGHTERRPRGAADAFV